MNKFKNSIVTATDLSGITDYEINTNNDNHFDKSKSSTYVKLFYLNLAISLSTPIIAINTRPNDLIKNNTDEICYANFELEVDPNNFALRVWTELRNLKTKNEEHKSLIFLFNQLHSNLNNLEKCDEFLIYSMSFNLTNNEIVHILNALCPVKNELKNWNIFLKKCNEIITSRNSAEYAKKLLMVAV